MRARGPKFPITEARRIESRGEVKLRDGWSWWSTSGFLACVLSMQQGFAALFLHVQPSLAPSSLPGLAWLVSSRSQRREAPLGWRPPASRAAQGLEPLLPVADAAHEGG